MHADPIFGRSDTHVLLEWGIYICRFYGSYF